MGRPATGGDYWCWREQCGAIARENDEERDLFIAPS